MSIEAYIMMNVKSGSEDEVCMELVKYDEVEEVAVIYGEYDALVKIDKLRSIPNIFLTATMLIAKQYK